MEAALGKGVVKEEKRVESGGDEEYSKEEAVAFKAANGSGKDCEDNNLRSSSPSDGDLNRGKQAPILTKTERSNPATNSKPSSSMKEQDDQLESAKAEMGEVREENQRLRMYLGQIMKDYRTLQMHFQDIVQQETQQNNSSIANSHENMEESELVSLSLGRRNSIDPKTKEKSKIPNSSGIEDQDHEDEGLALGLGSKFEASKSGPAESSVNGSPEISVEEVKEEAVQTWPPHKSLKTVRSGEDEVSQQIPAKKARVSVRVRCDAPTMHDGCQWRKYGQKIAKGNPCPRAYYRCTIAPSCPVRKQVQRCAEDMSILTTTYEGTHNHPLPISATAFASTTSAAASMLMSGSSDSSGSSSNLPSATATSTTSSGLHGLNYYLSDSSKTKQFYIPNSSISSSTSHPTITLDLTSNNPSSSSSHFNRMPTNFPPRYSANLNFSSLESNPLPFSLGNGVLTYGTQPNSRNQIGSLSYGNFPQENIYQSFMQRNNTLTPAQQSLPPDTLAAATKAITSDPNFQSALAAALTSIIGTGGGGAGANHAGGDKLGQNLKLGESFPVVSGFPSTSNANKCSSSYLNRASSTANSQTASLMFLPSSLTFSTSKSKSTSPGDNRDHIV